MPAEQQSMRPTRVSLRGLLLLARRNVIRQRARSVTTLGAIAFGVACLILSEGFVQDTFVQLGEAIIHSQSGHIQVARRGFFERGAHQPERYLIDYPDDQKKLIRSIEGVTDAMSRLNFAGVLGNGRADLAVIGEGIEPESEAKLGTFIKVIAGRNLSPTDKFGVLLGHGVANALRLAPGDRATVVTNTSDGAMNTLDLEVVGVFRSFSKDYDSRAIKIPLGAAQQLLDTRGANVIVTLLAATDETQRIAATLAQRLAVQGLEVRPWFALSDFYPKTVEMYRRQFGALQAVIFLLVILSVVNAVNATVFERMSEFGTIRAVGNRSREVFVMILAENALLGLLGATAGSVVGIVVAVAISQVGIPMPPPPNSDLGYTAHIVVTARSVLDAFLIGIMATMLGALIPAWRVSRTEIAAALRQGT